MKKIISIMSIMAFIFLMVNLAAALATGDSPSSAAADDNEELVVQSAIGLSFNIGSSETQNQNNEQTTPPTNPTTNTASGSSGGAGSPTSSGSSGGASIKKTTVNKVLTQEVIDTTPNWKINEVERIAESQPLTLQVLEALPGQKAQVLLYLTRAEKERILEMGLNEAKEEISKYELKPVNETTLFKKRVIAEIQLKVAAQDYNTAVQEYAKVNKAYSANKIMFADIKEEIKYCKKAETEECIALNDKASDCAKEYLINGAKLEIEYLNKLRARIEASEEIDEQCALEMLADINTAINQLNQAIEKANEAESKEELKETAKTISDIWKGIKYKEKTYALVLVQLKIFNIIERSQYLENKLDRIIADMETEGSNTTEINSKIDEFSRKVVEAKDKYNEARNLTKEIYKFNLASPSDEEKIKIDQTITDARGLLKDSNEDLKYANALLVEVVSMVKSLGGSITAVNATVQYRAVQIEED